MGKRLFLETNHSGGFPSLATGVLKAISLVLETGVVWARGLAWETGTCEKLATHPSLEIPRRLVRVEYLNPYLRRGTFLWNYPLSKTRLQSAKATSQLWPVYPVYLCTPLILSTYCANASDNLSMETLREYSWAG